MPADDDIKIIMYEFEPHLEKNGFTVKEIPVPAPSPRAEEFLDLCKRNICGAYDTNWGCPPGVGTISEITESLKMYSTAYLVSKKYVLDTKDRDAIQTATDEITDAVRAAVNTVKDRTVKAFGDGGCKYCGVCTYPDDECRYPSQRIDSISSHGFDMEEILKQVGEKLVFGDDAITLYALILVE
ncbi:MAG: DUF2284 domain-containing protein [Candidatus Methanomethylophilaceae archaeon]